MAATDPADHAPDRPMTSPSVSVRAARRRAGLLDRARTARRRRGPDIVAGFWFLSVVFSLIGPVLAIVVVAVDRAAGNAGVVSEAVISPESARTILGAISGSLITIASLTSSLTIVTLQLLSNQYTPRTVRGFMETKLSQVVLGSFIAIFLYCLIVLVTVREPGDENEPFVPSLAVLLSLVLAVVGLVLLVVFIHAMSQTIQVSTMAARVAHNTRAAVARCHPLDEAYPEVSTVAATDVGRRMDAAGHSAAVETGYVRDVDLDTLRRDLVGSGVTRIEIHARPGDFVTPATQVASWWGPADATDHSVERAVSSAVVVARERELRLDPGYGVRQLADIALRALSPAVNDPTTAITCLGYLRAILEDLAARALPATAVHAEPGGPAVVTARPVFDDYVGVLAEIAVYAGGDARVVWSILDALACVAASARTPQRRLDVLALRDEIRATARGEARLVRDRARLDSEGSTPSP